MDHGIKNWMFVSVAIVLAELGGFIGARFGWHIAEWTLDGLAVIAVAIAAFRWLLEKMKK